jgi:hypothetical protein
MAKNQQESMEAALMDLQGKAEQVHSQVCQTSSVQYLTYSLPPYKRSGLTCHLQGSTPHGIRFSHNPFGLRRLRMSLGRILPSEGDH